MTPFSTVSQSYSAAWARKSAFSAAYLPLRLLAYALITPAVGILVNFAVSLSSQTALTDQDIAKFLLTPGGFVAAILVLSVLLFSEVFSFAVMSAFLRAGVPDRWQAARMAGFAVLSRGPALLGFAVLFVLRVLVIVLPFAVVGLLIAKLFLTDYDINYYLSARPPDFFIAAGLMGLLGLAMAVLLLMRLTSWAVALHLVVFSGVAPTRAFAQSAADMRGRRMRFQVEVLIWLAVRVALLALVGLLAGLVLKGIPVAPERGLRVLLTLAVTVAVVWWIIDQVIAAVSLGALAQMVNGFFEGAQPMADVPPSAGIALHRKLIAGFAGLAVVCGIGLWAGASLLDTVKTEDNIEIIAHRGAAGSRPENTMASVHKAIEDKTDWVEIDVQETSDGHIVVLHDSDYMKLSGVDLKIWDATLDDLTDIDIGGWFDPSYADQRTPLLRDVLAAAKGRARVLIELKYYGHDVNLEQRVADIVEDMGMVDQIALMSLKVPAVQKMKALRPEWQVGVLAATSVGNLAGLDGDFVAVNAGIANSALVESIKARGKDLYVWTVNDPLQMSKMISMGVDGLITDEPALVHEVLRIRAGLSTPERLMLWLSQELGVRLNTKKYRDNAP